MHPPTEFKLGGVLSGIDTSKRAELVYDFNRVQPWKPSKKMTGLMNLSFIAANKAKQEKTGLRKTNNSALKFGGIKLSLKDIKKLGAIPDDPNEQAGKTFANLEGTLMEGMTYDAYAAAEAMKTDMTKEEFGISDKKIIIPSFGTTSKLFSQHFAILRELKQKIEQLKQAYEFQRSESRSWKQIDQILVVIAKACKYLDFNDMEGSKSEGEFDFDFAEQKNDEEQDEIILE